MQKIPMGNDGTRIDYGWSDDDGLMIMDDDVKEGAMIDDG